MEVQLTVKGIIKYITLTICFVMLAGVLTGCSSQTSKQADAIKAALESYSKSEENGFQITADNLKSQIQEQAKDQEQDAENAHYDISITVPDVSKIDHKDITFDIPEYSLEKPDSEKFKDEYKAAFEAGMINYLKSNKDIPNKEAVLSVDLALDEDTWAAGVSEPEVKVLSDEYDRQINAKVVESLEASQDFSKIQLAQSLKKYLQPVFLAEPYLDTVTLDNIEEEGENKYKVTISYADPKEVYEAAGNAYFDTLDILYGQQSVKRVTNSIADFLGDAIKGTTNQKTATFTVDNEELSEDFETLKSEVEEVRTTQMTALADRINKEVAVKRLALPKNGAGDKNSSGSSLTITVPKDSGHFFLKFYKLTGSDLNEEGKLAATVLIRQGKKATIKLPAGNYKMKEASGTKWYGVKHAFGSEGNYSVSQTLFKIKKNYSYTLSLRSTTSGNVSSKTITGDDF